MIPGGLKQTFGRTIYGYSIDEVEFNALKCVEIYPREQSKRNQRELRAQACLAADRRAGVRPPYEKGIQDILLVF